jgi:hypothetical protein
LPRVSKSVVTGLVDLLEGDQGLLLDGNLPDLSRLPERLLETLAHQPEALQHVFLKRHRKLKIYSSEIINSASTNEHTISYKIMVKRPYSLTPPNERSLR